VKCVGGIGKEKRMRRLGGELEIDLLHWFAGSWTASLDDFLTAMDAKVAARGSQEEFSRRVKG